jgi:hypothetical protein
MFGQEVGVLAQAIARAFDLEDDGVMQETVEERRGDDWITEHRRMIQFSNGWGA